MRNWRKSGCELGLGEAQRRNAGDLWDGLGLVGRIGTCGTDWDWWDGLGLVGRIGGETVLQPLDPPPFAHPSRNGIGFPCSASAAAAPASNT
eukprot:scaffold21281_cov73-Isochrysis_galbana.AAC.2